VLAAQPGESQGRPETTSSSQLIVSGGLPCHAPPESPKTRSEEPTTRPGGRSQARISYPDNAMAESFVSTFKNELVHPRRFQRRDEAELAVVEWIGWYG
jgi:hypothetical protein